MSCVVCHIVAALTAVVEHSVVSLAFKYNIILLSQLGVASVQPNTNIFDYFHSRNVNYIQ